MINKILKHAFNIIFLNNTLTNLPQKTIYQLTELLHETYIFQIKKGKTIITQGQPADYIYILLSGEGLVLNDIDWNINDTIPSLTVINVKNAINHDVDRVSGIFVLLIGVVWDSIFSFQR